MKEYYLRKAHDNFPKIYEEIIKPECEAKVLSNGSVFTLDLGNHYVGYFSFTLGWKDVYPDAPVRLKVRFCETAEELADDFSMYNGTISSSWLQEEIINVDFPGEYNMPRRYAARFIEITVICAPQNPMLSDFKFRAVTSADVSKLEKTEIDDEELVAIDKASVNTLKNCMQRVFEDGPKRDRRLWIGDLRLEALVNYYTFNNLSLVRRCLYLFAASETKCGGYIGGYVYENPEFVSGTWYIRDYALLFVMTACDYYNHTGDIETFLDIYEPLKAQMNAVHGELDSDGITNFPVHWDAFIDWSETLNKRTSLHGLYLYVLSAFKTILEKIGHSDAPVFAERYNNAMKAARKHLYNNKENNFVNQKDSYQYSVHSAVFMILGGVIEGEKAQEALLNAINSKESLKPLTPYAHHYVVEALMKLGLKKEGFDYIKSYWGGMVKQDADTFYECYVPSDPDFSPYGSRLANSNCHAWSTTPSYFIRKEMTQVLTE